MADHAAPAEPGNPKAYLKAITGGILAGLGVLYVALNDGDVSGQEAVQIAIATLTGAGAVYIVPNAPTQ